MMDNSRLQKTGGGWLKAVEMEGGENQQNTRIAIIKSI
jgi:hypothetical protein